MTFSFSSPRARLVALAIFCVIVFLFGGGSRADIPSLILLRPLAVLFAVYALAVMPAGRLAQIRLPLVLLGVLIGWMVLQLIPLPFQVWSTLPGREEIAELDAILGLGELSRPLSLSPAGTWNSLLALCVPLAALLLCVAVDKEDRWRILWVIFAIAMVSAILGVLQLVAPSGSPLYFYRITNADSAVGLFANRNHQAVFLSIGIIVAAQLTAAYHKATGSWSLMALLPLAGIFFLAPVIVAIGSRAGAISAAIAVVVAATMLRDTYLAKSPAGKAPAGKATKQITKLILIAGLGAIIALFAWSSERTSLSRLGESGTDEDLRSQVLPTLFDMAWHNLAFGTGFGTFEQAYKVIEPNRLLSPSYLNHAHNDWLQWIIEGGLPAAIVLTVLLLALANRLRASWGKAAKGSRVAAPAFPLIIILAIFMFASIVDYPLRTPSLAALAAVVIGLIWADYTFPTSFGKGRNRRRA